MRNNAHAPKRCTLPHTHTPADPIPPLHAAHYPQKRSAHKPAGRGGEKTTPFVLSKRACARPPPPSRKEEKKKIGTPSARTVETMPQTTNDQAMLRHAYANAQRRSWTMQGKGRDVLVWEEGDRQKVKRGVVVGCCCTRGLRKGWGLRRKKRKGWLWGSCSVSKK